MNRENITPRPGRMLAGFLLGILLDAVSPLILLTEIFSLMPVVIVPAIGIVLLYRWAGKAPATLSCMLLMVFTAQMLGSTLMWMVFFIAILPVVLLLLFEKKPFFTQMKISIAAFCAGVVLAVIVLYSSYGGNMIERTLASLPETMRSLPVEALSVPMENLGAALGYELTADKFYQVFDDIITSTTPVYQLNLPGLIFNGALSSAVLCAAFSARMLSKREGAPEGVWVPLQNWALPSSTTGGVLLMLLASYILLALDMQYGQALYYAVYNIAVPVFSIQALASMARYLHGSALNKRVQTAILVCIAVLCLVGASMYVALYGCASAIFGRYGALRQRMEEKMKNNHHSDEE